MQYSNFKKINITELAMLALAALAFSPKGDEEVAQSDWADATLRSLPSDLLYTLVDKHLMTEEGRCTGAGMKLLLNGLSFTPNFKNLAESDFSTAVKMLFEGQKGMAEVVDRSESKQIVPKKNSDGTWVDTRMCDSLLGVRNWIDNVTTTYQASLVPTTKTTTKTKKA